MYGISSNHCVIGNIFGNNRTRTNYRTLPNMYARQNDDSGTDPNIILNYNCPLVCKPLLIHRNISPVKCMISDINAYIRPHHNIVSYNYFSVNLGSYTDSRIISQFDRRGKFRTFFYIYILPHFVRIIFPQNALSCF